MQVVLDYVEQMSCRKLKKGRHAGKDDCAGVSIVIFTILANEAGAVNSFNCAYIELAHCFQ